MEKGENWLIAKKPFGGNSCASCEAFIGELHENRDYIPWNKLKESADKLSRMGNGFSKMLQMVDVEDKNKESHLNNNMYIIDPLHTSSNIHGVTNQENFIKKHLANMTSNLPKVKTKVRLITEGGNVSNKKDYKNTSMNSSRVPVISKSNRGHHNQNITSSNNNNISLEMPDFKDKEELEIDNEQQGPKM